MFISSEASRFAAAVNTYEFRRTMEMSRNLVLVIFCSVWSLSKSQEPVSFQVGDLPTNSYQTVEPQKTELKSPLLRALISRLEPKESNPSTPNDLVQEPVKPGNGFFSALLEHLATRRTKNGNTSNPTDRLELTIRDGSSNTVNIEFLPTGLDNSRWNSIVDLLADALAFVVEEAERQGYTPGFKYSIQVSEPGPRFHIRLGSAALKSAVG